MDELKKLERVKIVGKGHLDPSLLSEKDWSNPDMTGWITKEGAVNRTLKKRWFVLQGNKMMYFKSNVNMKLIGHFELNENDQVAALPNKDMYNKSCKIHKWRIATPLRTWKFINESLDEMKAWIHAVSKVINPNYTFGMPLSKIVEREERTAISTIRVPMIVQRCIQYLRDKGGADTEGIFRISGEGPKMKELRKAFNTQIAHKVVIDDDDTDTLHVVANILKVFLRELQDSLVPQSYFDDIKKIMQQDDITKVKKEIKEKVNTLPVCNFETLKYIFEYLKEVEAKQEHNKMTAVNISLVFGPCLIQSKDQISALADTTYQCGLAKIFLDHFNYIFKNIEDENKISQNTLQEELNDMHSILNKELMEMQSILNQELKGKQDSGTTKNEEQISYLRPRSRVIRGVNNILPTARETNENIIVVNSIDDLTNLDDDNGIIDLSKLK